MARNFMMDRRAMLLGAGAALSLPLMEAMVGKPAKAAPGDIPKRFVFIYCGIPPVGEGVDGKTGKPVQYVLPDAAGPLDAPFKLGLEPLEKAGLRPSTTVISSMRIPRTGSGNGRRYGSGGFHYETMGPIVSGTSDLTNKFSRYALGPSCDWLLAQQVGAATRLPSLVYMAQSAAFSGYTLDYISYKPRTGKYDPMWEPPTLRVDPIVSPRAAFEQLFTGFTPKTGTEPPPIDPETLRRQEILKRVQASYSRLQPKLGAADRLRLDEHVSNIRSLELRVNALLETKPTVTSACVVPTAPGPDPAASANYANEDARCAAYVDLIHMAFACDLSRVVSFEMTSSMSGIVLPTSLGITYRDWDGSARPAAPLHEATHGQGDNMTVAECIRWHMKHVAALAKKLKDTPEGTGTMLDNTAIVFVMEAGLGNTRLESGTIVGERPPHTSEGMCAIVIGGKNLGMQLGQHIVANDQHPSQVILTAMKAVSPAITALGEITKELPGLRV
jgi:hypothetical protein